MILITGGYGCIGSELVKWLLRNSDERVLVASRTASASRTERVFHDVDRERLSCIELDVTDQDGCREVFSKYEISRVAHLAALQTPDCNARRNLGLQINLGGTQNLLEAIKTSGKKLARYVFASSIAVYGPRASYPPGPVPMLAHPRPVNVYGVWKLASEQISGFFCDDTGIPTVCLRPGVLFGPGRDAGLTSTPTTAMKCVALGRPYEIPYETRQDYLYAPDVGGAFGNALMEPFADYGVFTLPARTVGMQDLVAALRQAAEDVSMDHQFKITFGTDDVPFICDLDFEPFRQVFPNSPHTALDVALRESLTVFKQQVSKGWLGKQDIA